MTRKVVYAPEASQDLLDLYRYIAERASPARARAYTARIEAHCQGFVDFPERGTRRDDLRPGLRITSFQRRLTIAFHLTSDTIVIDRILYGGRPLHGEGEDLSPVTD